MSQRVTITATLEDGTTEVLPIRPVGLIAAERKFGGDIPQMEGALYAAWYGLRAGNPDMPDFEEWLASLADVDVEDDTTPDPTDAD